MSFLSKLNPYTWFPNPNKTQSSSSDQENKNLSGSGITVVSWNNSDSSAFPMASSWNNYANVAGIAQAFEAYWNEGYCVNPIVYACIEQIAWAIAGIPLRVYRNTGKTADENPELQAKQHPLAKLMQNPSDDYGMSELMYQYTVSYLTAGNAYMHIPGPKAEGLGIPQLMNVTPPSWILPVPSSDMIHVDHYSYLIPTKTQTNMPTDVICQVKTWNPIYQYLGLPPLMAAGRSIDLNNQARVWNHSLLKNGATPSGAFTTKPGAVPPSQAQMKDISDAVHTNWAGAINAGEPIVVPGALDFTPMGFNAVDMAWERTMSMSSQEICNVLHVPIQLLGMSGTFANYAQARRAFYTENVIPLLKKFCSAFSLHFQKRYSDDSIYVGFKTEDIDALANDLLIEAQTMSQSHWLTINEKRGRGGMTPLAGPAGDILLCPTSATDVSLLGEPQAAPEPKPEPEVAPAPELAPKE